MRKQRAPFLNRHFILYSLSYLDCIFGLRSHYTSRFVKQSIPKFMGILREITNQTSTFTPKHSKP